MDLGHKNRFFIPFTNSDVFISDFYNGVFEVYPSYRLLVVENTGFREFSGASVFGIYDMASQIYETVNLNDKWEEIPAAELERRRRTGEVIVERKSPFSIAITPAMTEYFNALKANEIKKSFDFWVSLYRLRKISANHNQWVSWYFYEKRKNERIKKKCSMHFALQVCSVYIKEYDENLDWTYL